MLPFAWIPQDRGHRRAVHLVHVCPDYGLRRMIVDLRDRKHVEDPVVMPVDETALPAHLDPVVLAAIEHDHSVGSVAENLDDPRRDANVCRSLVTIAEVLPQDLRARRIL